MCALIKHILQYSLLIFIYFSYSQNYQISGLVSDSDGNSLSDVSIVLKNNSSQTYSDTGGRFQLKPLEFPCTIIVSHVGYETKEITIESRADSLLIQLEKRAKILREVIVRDRKVKARLIGSPKNPKGTFSYICYNSFEQIGLVINNVNNELYSRPAWLSAKIKIERPFAGMGVKPDGTHRIRLRIYPLTAKGELLPSDLLQEDLTIAPQKGGWIEIDLEPLQLTLPQEGFILVVEWLPKPDNDIPNQITPYGANLLIKGHEISEEEKRYYALFQYNHVHREPGGSEFIKARHELEQRHIPCFQLEYVELDESGR
ncbi:MAG: carboxypeptidase-like regulatory domain-containing protein [Ekhidna sp.]|nr:carboxypeptidase-like regulatory domain-containing protein [Ekhidna sp.]